MRLLSSASVFGAVVLIGFWAAPAMAQEAAEVEASDQRIDVIVVTARKREENLQDVPVSITAFTAEDIASRLIESPRDIIAANFVLPQSTNTVRNYVSMRGIFQVANSLDLESGFSMYIDGVHKGRNFSYDSELFDVERIEILRGPQGTLFGKNTIAGVMNVITKQPGNEFEGEAKVELGNFGLVRGGGSVNIPFIEDKLAMRFSLQGTKREGFVTNTSFPDSSGREGSVDHNSARMQMLYTPTENFRATIAADFFSADNLAYPSEISATGTSVPSLGDDIPYTTQQNIQPVEEREDMGVSLTMEYEFANGHTLTSITGARKSETQWLLDDDGTEIDFLNEDLRDRVPVFTQEFRLASQTGGFLDYVLGLYYFDEPTESSNPIPFVEYPGGPFIVYYGRRIDTTDYAAFGHVNLHFTDSLTAYAGLRFTDERKKLEAERRALPITHVFPDSFIFGLTTDGTGTPPLFQQELRDRPVTWEVGVQYKPTDGVMAYAEVATGFKGAGFNTATQEFVDPEYLTAYEAGVKAALFNNRLIVNVAGFFNDYEDLQVRSLDSTTMPITVRLQNAASVEAKGFDLEVQALPTDNLDLQFAVGYVDSTYKSFPGVSVAGGIIDASGNRLPMTPPWTVSSGATYTYPLANDGALVMNALFNFLDERYQSGDAGANLPQNFLDTYHAVNGRIGYQSPDRNWEVFMWARNITNEDAVVNRSTLSLITPRAEWPDGVILAHQQHMMPRTYGLTFSAKF